MSPTSCFSRALGNRISNATHLVLSSNTYLRVIVNGAMSSMSTKYYTLSLGSPILMPVPLFYHGYIVAPPSIMVSLNNPFIIAYPSNYQSGLLGLVTYLCIIPCMASVHKSPLYYSTGLVHGRLGLIIPRLKVPYVLWLIPIRRALGHSPPDTRCADLVLGPVISNRLSVPYQVSYPQSSRSDHKALSVASLSGSRSAGNGRSPEAASLI